MTKLEPAIGEVFQIDNIVFVCERAQTDDCIGCSMNHVKKCDYVCCCSNERSDGKSVKFKKVASIVPETYYNVEIKVTPKEDLETVLLKTIPSEKARRRQEAIQKLFIVAEYVNEGKQVDFNDCYQINKRGKAHVYEIIKSACDYPSAQPLFVTKAAARKAIEIMGNEIEYCFI